LSEQKIIYKIHTSLLFIVLGLAIIALVAESLPEIKAKMIVVPTLVLVIGLIIIEMRVKLRKN
jgi:hypothetical protein